MDLPEFIIEDAWAYNGLEHLIDLIAANTRWSNVDVMRAVVRLIDWICKNPR